MQDNVSEKVQELRRRMGVLAWDMHMISNKELLVKRQTELQRLDRQLKEIDHNHLK
ncbi:MAG: hypothetical protein V1729_06505 [Candidatus Woesearchaeota archaeon]